MAYEERNVWSSLVVSVIGVATYVLLLLRRTDDGPLTEVTWWPLMLGTVLGSIVVAIAVSIAWGMVAARRDPDGAGRSDERDREIARMGSHVGQAFPVIAGLGVIVLSAVRADPFWVAHTIYLGFVLSAVVSAVASLVAYRRGLV